MSASLTASRPCPRPSERSGWRERVGGSCLTSSSACWKAPAPKPGSSTATNAYYYTSREQYFRAYHAIRQRAHGLVPAELREKYDRQVQAGQALYVDQIGRASCRG